MDGVCASVSASTATNRCPSKYGVYGERMKYELSVIQSMGFAGYFLIVADFIDYARRTGVPVGPGRGSSAGSLVAYGLGITGVDPIEYDILFERFLNPERISMPDIDVDFCMRGRDSVIRYVAEKYDGTAKPAPEEMRVAQIVTFGTLQAKAALRDVGRVLGMPYADVDRIAKLVPEALGTTLEEAHQQSPELRARVEADGQVARLFETARKLEGLTRHASKHAAGVVIGNRPLIETVPLYRDAKSGDIMTQYDMRCVEKVGLIKFDFLGLKTLTVIADAEKLIRAAAPRFLRREAAARRRAAPSTCSRSGDTEGVFQVESSGMTDLVIKLKPRTFKEIIPLVALYRPGPLGSGMVDDYVNRKNGVTKVEYLLPELEELTAETLGVIVYQDQVLQIANKLAGFSLGEADLLRRAMGKKKAEEMAKQRERFVSGATARNIDKAKAEEVFELIAKFAEYGFAKSHSTAYALITYQTAYLKANHAREYLAALLTVESGNHDKLTRYIAHAREKGIEILPPDVNESVRDFTASGDGIRFGFAGIKNVGDGAIEAIVEARAATGGPLRQPLRLQPARGLAAREPARGGEPRQGRRIRLAAPEPRSGLGSARRGARARRRRPARSRDRTGKPLRRQRRARARPRAQAARCGGLDRHRAARLRTRAARLLRDGTPARRRRARAGALHRYAFERHRGQERSRRAHRRPAHAAARDAHAQGRCDGLRYPRRPRRQPSTW